MKTQVDSVFFLDKRCFLFTFPEGGQTRKHCFLAFFTDGRGTRKLWFPCFQAMFPEGQRTRNILGDLKGRKSTGNKYLFCVVFHARRFS